MLLFAASTKLVLLSCPLTLISPLTPSQRIGELDPLTQRACKDMKLMDAVFEMGLAVYRRAAPDPPFGEPKRDSMANPKGIQKLVQFDDVSVNSYTQPIQTPSTVY